MTCIQSLGRKINGVSTVVIDLLGRRSWIVGLCLLGLTSRQRRPRNASSKEERGSCLSSIDVELLSLPE